MISQKVEINVTNLDFPFKNFVHENVIAEVVRTLSDKDLGPEYRTAPIGSSNPIPLREIIDLMFKATNYTGQINWIEPKSPPFRIDSTGAIELGYNQLTAGKKVNGWILDAIS